jgi:hypothetical protein
MTLPGRTFTLPPFDPLPMPNLSPTTEIVGAAKYLLTIATFLIRHPFFVMKIKDALSA